MEIATCISGLQRTLLDHVVVHSYRSHLLAPLQQRGHKVSTYVVLNEEDEANVALHHNISTHFAAKRVALIRRRLNESASCKLALVNDAYGGGRGPNLAQWIGVGMCYKLIEEDEAQRGSRYDIIVRIRSDIVFLDPFPLPTDMDHVFVPENGMSKRSFHMCQSAPYTSCRCATHVPMLLQGSDKRPVAECAASGSSLTQTPLP